MADVEEGRKKVKQKMLNCACVMYVGGSFGSGVCITNSYSHVLPTTTSLKFPIHETTFCGRINFASSFCVTSFHLEGALKMGVCVESSI